MTTTRPLWFKLLLAWRGRGRYGLTLPFLAGSVARHLGRDRALPEDAKSLLKEMIESPVEDYLVNVRWCGDYQPAVFDVQEVSSPYNLKDRGIEISCPSSGATAMVLDKNLAAVWKTPSSEASLIEVLLRESERPIREGKYSLHWTEDGVQFIPLQQEDIEFIEEALRK